MSFRLPVVCPLAPLGFLGLVDAKPRILVGVLKSQPEGARIFSSSGRPNLVAGRLRGRLFLRKRVDQNAHPPYQQTRVLRSWDACHTIKILDEFVALTGSRRPDTALAPNASFMQI